VSPFKPPSSGFGKLPNKEQRGGYVGELVDVIEGPIFTDNKTGKPTPKMAWVFRLFSLNGQPFLDAESDPPGQQFIATALSNQTMAMRSTARKWFAAMLNRPVADGEDPDKLIAEAQKLRFMLQFGASDTDKTKLSTIMQFEGVSTLSDELRAAILGTFGPPPDYSDKDGGGTTYDTDETPVPPPQKIDAAEMVEQAAKAQLMADKAVADAAAAEAAAAAAG